MIAEQIEEDARRLDEIIAEYNREANRAKQSRDEFHRRASELADRRDKLQKKAKSLSAEAAVYKARRDDANLTAKECRARRDEWNDRGARMRASGGLGDIGECKSQANSWHQKAVKASEDANTAHEKMHQLYDEADRLRAEAQKCHEQYLDCKRGAEPRGVGHDVHRNGRHGFYPGVALCRRKGETARAANTYHACFFSVDERLFHAEIVHRGGKVFHENRRVGNIARFAGRFSHERLVKSQDDKAPTGQFARVNARPLFFHAAVWGAYDNGGVFLARVGVFRRVDVGRYRHAESVAETNVSAADRRVKRSDVSVCHKNLLECFDNSGVCLYT